MKYSFEVIDTEATVTEANVMNQHTSPHRAVLMFQCLFEKQLQ